MIAAQLRTVNIYADDGNLLSRVILWFFTKLKKPGPFRSISDATRMQMLQLYSDHAGHFANRRDVYQLAKVVHENRSDKSL